VKVKEVTAFDPVNNYIYTVAEYHCDLCLRSSRVRPLAARTRRPFQLEIDGVLIKNRHYHPRCACRLQEGQEGKGRIVKVIELQVDFWSGEEWQ